MIRVEIAIRFAIDVAFVAFGELIMSRLHRRGEFSHLDCHQRFSAKLQHEWNLGRPLLENFES